jgi:hypothetical protein
MKIAAFACLMLALLTMTFATSLVSTERYALWDRFTVSYSDELYTATTVVIPAIFGNLRLLLINNTGGSDFNVTLSNDVGTLQNASGVVVPGASTTSRDNMNYTFMGKATLIFNPRFSNGSSLATSTLYCAMDVNTTSVCKAGGNVMSWSDGSRIVVGKFLNATALDGLNDVLIMNNTTALNLSGFNGASLAFWMSEDSPVNNSYLWHQGSAANDTTIRLAKGINNSGAYWTKLGNDWNLTFSTNRNISIQSISYNATSLLNGAWHHYVFASNNTTMDMYIDGVRVANTSFVQASVNQSLNSYRFGDGATNITCTIHSASRVEPTGCTYDDHQIDEIYAFQSVLTAGNVSYLYNATKRQSGSVVLVMKQ